MHRAKSGCSWEAASLHIFGIAHNKTAQQHVHGKHEPEISSIKMSRFTNRIVLQSQLERRSRCCGMKWLGLAPPCLAPAHSRQRTPGHCSYSVTQSAGPDQDKFIHSLRKACAPTSSAISASSADMTAACAEAGPGAPKSQSSCSPQ